MTRRATKSHGKPTEIGEDLEKLAKHIAKQAIGENLGEDDKQVSFENKVGAFKALSNYYAMKNKLELPNPDEEKFNGWQKQIGSLGKGRRGNGDADPDEARDD